MSEILSVDRIWKLYLKIIAEREEFDQKGAANAAYCSSIGLLLACQEQDWEKHIEMGDEGSVVLLEIPHVMS